MPNLLSTLNPLDLMGFIAIFSFSFASSLHCGLMCSPLVCSALNDRVKLNNKGIWLYNLGRVLSYTLMGGLLGASGEIITSYLPGFASVLTKLIGIILIALGAKKLWETSTNMTFNLPKKMLAKVVMIPSIFRDFSLGFFTILLPCMTLTPALACAAMTASPLKGSLLMFAFALGTLPTMLSVSLLPMYVYRRFSYKNAKYAVSVFLIAAGLITFVR